MLDVALIVCPVILLLKHSLLVGPRGDAVYKHWISSRRVTSSDSNLQQCESRDSLYGYNIFDWSVGSVTAVSGTQVSLAISKAALDAAASRGQKRKAEDQAPAQPVHLSSSSASLLFVVIPSKASKGVSDQS